MNVLERDGERLSPLDYAIIGDGNGNSFRDIVDYLKSKMALSVNAIREMAATAIQSTFRGFKARKNLKMQHPDYHAIPSNNSALASASRISEGSKKPWVTTSSKDLKCL